MSATFWCWNSTKDAGVLQWPKITVELQNFSGSFGFQFLNTCSGDITAMVDTNVLRREICTFCYICCKFGKSCLSIIIIPLLLTEIHCTQTKSKLPLRLPSTASFAKELHISTPATAYCTFYRVQQPTICVGPIAKCRHDNKWMCLNLPLTESASSAHARLALRSASWSSSEFDDAATIHSLLIIEPDQCHFVLYAVIVSEAVVVCFSSATAIRGACEPGIAV